MKSTTAVSQLSALAHAGRLDLYRRLVRAGPEGIAAGALAAAANINFTTASAQLAVLTNAGLVRNRRDGRSIIYRADYRAVGGLIAYLMRDCCQGRKEIVEPIMALDL